MNINIYMTTPLTKTDTYKIYRKIKLKVNYPEFSGSSKEEKIMRGNMKEKLKVVVEAGIQGILV